MMIPTELLTLLTGTATGGLMKIMAARTEATRAREQALLAQTREAREHQLKLANSGTSGYQFTRRIIALMVIFAVMVLPKLAAIFAPDIAITYGWTTSTEGLLWGLFGGGENQLIWNTVQGLVITPLDTNFAMAIAGLYFGASIADMKK